MNNLSKEQKEVRALFRKLIKSRCHDFPSEGPLRTSQIHGVYIIYSPEGSVLHVGRTTRAKGGLEQRLRNHLAGASSFSNQYIQATMGNHMSILRQGYSFRFIEVSDMKQRAYLEAYTIGMLCPEHIGTSGG